MTRLILGTVHGIAEWQIVIDEGHGAYRYLESTSLRVQSRARQARDNDWAVVVRCDGREVVDLEFAERAA